MERKVRSRLICSTCLEPITENGEGTFIWGMNTKKHPFTIVHKGSKCDKWINDGLDGYCFSMEMRHLMERVNSKKLSNRELKDSILYQHKKGGE